MIIFLFILLILPIIGFWVLFTKAGRPGWAAIVPIYNFVTLLNISGKSGWWILLFCIPIVNIVFYILMLIGLCKNFGKGSGFVIGLLFLPFIFFLILAFSDAKYLPVEN